MKEKIFFISSDEHGYFDAVLEAEKECGYDENNPDHFRISAGDFFDRGKKSVEIYEYYYRLYKEKKMLLTKGNHTLMFIDFLENKNHYLNFFNFRYNGLNSTIDSFLNKKNSFIKFITETYSDEEQLKMTKEEWDKAWIVFEKRVSKEIQEKYPELLQWLKDLPDYIELKNSIITHGMIDTKSIDWKKPLIGWEKCHWASPEEAAHIYNNTNKHIYLGHINSGRIRQIFNEDENNNDIYTRPGNDITYLDGMVPVTNKVNIAIVKDEFL